MNPIPDLPPHDSLVTGGRLLPDYAGGSLLNLMASCSAARGGPALHPVLGSLDGDELARARNVVLFVVDGLGYHYLKARSTSVLASHLEGRVTSVFPSTTASAITTTFTGLSPAEHGLTGWFAWFGEAGTIAAPLPFMPRGQGDSLEARGVRPEMLYRGTSLFDMIVDEPFVVSYRPIVDSTYNRFYCARATRLAYDDLGGLVEQTVAAVNSSDARKFVYTYYPQFDTTSHRFGNASEEAARVFDDVDRAFAQLVEKLAGTDTMVLLTADHGFIDCPAENAFDVSECPEVGNLLAHPLTGERRVAFCHVLPGRQEEFAELASSWLAGKADVLPGRIPVEEGWFGGGDVHPHLASRAGDFVLLMRGTATVKDWVPGEPRHLHIGNHGGLSAEEMHIPLVVART